jgi:hypothetical protein
LTLEEGVEMDLSQILPYVLAHAQWIGPALLVVGLLVRLVGKFISRVLFVAGFLATAAIAYQEWQVAHSLLWAGGILIVGLVVFGLLAWTIRGISFLFAFGLLAAAFYLILHGWVGPAFAASTLGSLTWAGATIATMIITGFHGMWLHRAVGAAAGA